MTKPDQTNLTNLHVSFISVPLLRFFGPLKKVDCYNYCLAVCNTYNCWVAVFNSYNGLEGVHKRYSYWEAVPERYMQKREANHSRGLYV